MTLKELRVKYNLTQAALAKELGVTGNTVSAIECGRLKLSDKLADKIREVYGEEIDSPAKENRAPKAKAPAAAGARAAAPTVILQSPFGGEITPEALVSIIGEADRIYVRIDQNKAYWVRGDETGDIDIW